MKKIAVPLSVAGVDRLLKELENYKRWLQDRSSVFLDRLADEGLNIASVKFGRAVYDGTNDVTVSVEARDSNSRAVVAIGSSVLFIEFGTGVTYPDNHPEAAELGMNRGEYGSGHGKQKSWGYYGNPGTNGKPVQKTNGSTVIITHGNPANMAMYETIKELEQNMTRIAKEVFV